jgi:hypothetical protein
MVRVRRLTHLVVLVAFLFSCGGQWYVLQCVAWARMIRQYSAMVPLRQAVEMTFSGRYPCALCKAIAEKKSTEQQKVLCLEKCTKKFVLPIQTAAPRPPGTAVVYFYLDKPLLFRSVAPSVPPPRTSLLLA